MSATKLGFVLLVFSSLFFLAWTQEEQGFLANEEDVFIFEDENEGEYTPGIIVEEFTPPEIDDGPIFVSDGELEIIYENEFEGEFETEFETEFYGEYTEYEGFAEYAEIGDLIVAVGRPIRSRNTRILQEQVETELTEVIIVDDWNHPPEIDDGTVANIENEIQIEEEEEYLEIIIVDDWNQPQEIDEGIIFTTDGEAEVLYENEFEGEFETEFSGEFVEIEDLAIATEAATSSENIRILQQEVEEEYTEGVIVDDWNHPPEIDDGTVGVIENEIELATEEEEEDFEWTEPESFEEDAEYNEEEYNSEEDFISNEEQNFELNEFFIDDISVDIELPAN